MNVEDLNEFALSMPYTEACLPFGPDVLVYKVNGKMFLLVSLNSNPLQFNAKCLPELAEAQREQYPNIIIPGYHMNKKNWNTIIIQGSLSNAQLKTFITDSYNLVFNKNKKPKQ